MSPNSFPLISHKAISIALIDATKTPLLAKSSDFLYILCHITSLLIGFSPIKNFLKKSIPTENALDIVEVFLETEFEEGGRHERRVGKIDK